MNKSTIIIVGIIAVLLLCCCSIVAGAGVIVFLSDDDNGGKTTTETTKETTKETTVKKEDTTPTAGDVKEALENARSYSFTGELVFDDGYVTQISGNFISPDREYCFTSEPMANTEEITIGSMTYVRAQGGVWSSTTDPYFALHQRDELDNFFDDILDAEKSIDDGSYWKLAYYDSSLDEDWYMLVDKQTNLPYQLVVSYTNTDDLGIVATFTFSNFDDPTISIERPEVN